MQFVLNEVVVSESSLPADLTILRYLREYKQLCGTKEGCASGDCGACTVMLGELAAGSIHYHTVNACIAPMGIVAGKHLVTVEHLSYKGLHPSQEAMVAAHGSQCGFCTPGFVLSLANLYEHVALNEVTSVSREIVCDAISGNLCRCTGYRPIVEAGLSMFNREKKHWLGDEASIGKINSLTNSTFHKTYFQPASTAELNQLLKKYPEARLIAGGTDLMLEVTQKFKTFKMFIDLSKVEEMSQLQYKQDKYIIGAALSYTRMEELFTNIFPALCTLLKRLGSRQIRNRGTLGGNLGNASPVADMPPILLCMDAVLEIGTPKGKRQERVENFFLDYKQTNLKQGEYIIAAHIDAPLLKHFHRFYKVSKRFEDDISSVMAAIRFNIVNNVIKEARIAYGGMAATPIRAVGAEAILTGANLQSSSALDSAIEQIKTQLHPITDVRASTEYRSQVAANLLRKAWLEANGMPLLNIMAGSEK